MVTVIQVLCAPGNRTRILHLKGLDPEKRYRIEGEDTIIKGDSLMYAGLPVPAMKGDFAGKVMHLVAENDKTK